MINNIVFKNVYKSYGETSVIENINLEIKSGERLVLLGPSGCGKSTLLRMISGLEEPSSGQIYFGDKLVNEVEVSNRNVAMVFQNYALYPHMDVWNNITFGLKMAKVNKEEIKKRADEAIKILKLEGFEKRYPRELSGGQRQRVALCRAIVKKSPFFLLDEPLSNLDVHLRNSSREELVKIHNLYKPTFVYVTHDQIEAMTIGHRIAVLNEGKLQQIATPDYIYSNPANIFVARFIGTPQINIFKLKVEFGNVLFKNIKILIEDRKEKLLEGRKEVYLGIRPENVVVTRERKEESILGKIVKIENYGNQKCLQVNIGFNENILVSVSNENNFKKNEEIFVKISQKIIFFDVLTEKNLDLI